MRIELTIPKKFTSIRLFLLLLIICFTVSTHAAQDPAADQPDPTAEVSSAQTAGATLVTARSIFVEPMSEGFDKFLADELGRSKDLYTVSGNKDDADLWMKGVLTVIPAGNDSSTAQESDFVHSKQLVKGMATVVVLPRDGKGVLWQGDARLLSMPGTHIPGMAKVLVAQFRKAVKDSRKASHGKSTPH
jgi:hypothetical protein